jgi:hypothetical protein
MIGKSFLQRGPSRTNSTWLFENSSAGHIWWPRFQLARAAERTEAPGLSRPATALALNMHFYSIGAAADIAKAGDASANWILEEAGAGRIFASGHGESGNDAGITNSLAGQSRYPMAVIVSLAAKFLVHCHRYGIGSGFTDVTRQILGIHLPCLHLSSAEYKGNDGSKPGMH